MRWLLGNQGCCRWLYILPFVCLALVSISLCVVSAYLFCRAVYATWLTGALPCDQPLVFYMLATMLASYISARVKRPSVMRELHSYFGRHPPGQMLVSAFVMLPTWFVIAWGFYIVGRCKTCQQTNPDLYCAIRSYLHFQLVNAILVILITVFILTTAQRLILNMSSMVQQHGCRLVVERFQAIASDSSCLVCDEDGTIKECCICQCELTALTPAAEPQDIVSTPCGHLFHRECLLQWCRGHMDCPLCRGQVGAPDPVEGALTPEAATV